MYVGVEHVGKRDGVGFSGRKVEIRIAFGGRSVGVAMLQNRSAMCSGSSDRSANDGDGGIHVEL